MTRDRALPNMPAYLTDDCVLGGEESLIGELKVSGWRAFEKSSRACLELFLRVSPMVERR